MGINSKDKRDVYYKMAKKEGYRARSAYKLMQIDEEFKILSNKNRIVDLCGAPGSWSQLVAKRLPGQKIIAIDIQDMEPIEGVVTLKGDITTEQSVMEIKTIFGDKKAELVLFDGAPDVTGIHSLDEFLQVQLVLKALAITLKIEEIGCGFVGKVFRGGYSKYLVAHFKKYFGKVQLVKPKASRSSSIECFIVCKDLYNTTIADFVTDNLVDDIEVTACGSGPDPDLTTNEGDGLPPVCSPINPAYSVAINSRKNN